MTVIIMTLVLPTCSGLRVVVFVGDKCRVLWPIDGVRGEDVKVQQCTSKQLNFINWIPALRCAPADEMENDTSDLR